MRVGIDVAAARRFLPAMEFTMTTWRLKSVPALWAALAAAGCSALPLPAPAGRPSESSFEFGAKYWQAKPDGHLDIEAGSQPATSTHAGLSDQLGLDSDRELLWNASLDMGEHRFGIEYIPLGFSGSNDITRGYQFHGASYPKGDRVSSDLDLTTWALKWDYAFSKEKDTADAFRVGLGAWWWNLDTHVTAAPSGANEDREFSRVYPGAHAQWTTDFGSGATLDLYGALAANSFHRRLYDWGAELLYPISDAIRVGLGYRWMVWDFNETTNDGDFDFSGPLATLSVRF